MSRPVRILLAASMALPTMALAGKPMGAGIAVKQVQAPGTIVAGVPSLSVPKIAGTGGDQVRKELLAGLADTERQVGMGTMGDVASGVIQAGAQVGGQMLASKIPVGGKIVATATETVGGLAAGAVEGDKLQLDDGLRIDVFEVKTSGGKGTLGGALKVTHKDESYEKEVDLKDKDGNVIKDENGVPLKTKVSCRRRNVTNTFTWSLDAGGDSKASGKKSHTLSDDRCAEDIKNLKSVESLAKGAAYGLGNEVILDIMPSWHVFRVGMKRNKGTAMPIATVKEGDHMAAMCMFEHLKDGLPDDFAAPLSLGGLYEALGHHDLSIAAYTEAEGRKSTKLGRDGLERVTARKAEVAQMVDAYGLTWKITDPDLGACPARPEGHFAAAKKKVDLTVDSGEPVKVDKGTPFVVLSEDGGTVQVQLLDGTRGTVPAKLVK